LRQLAIHWLSAFLAVLLASKILPIFTPVPTWEQAAVFAVILAFLNILIRPVIKVITCPLNILTLGLFTLVINAFTFWLAARLFGQLQLNDIVWAFIGAILVSLVSFVVDRLLEKG
jgi:putative membrane protein